MTLFEQNCNDMKMAALGRYMKLFYAIKNIQKSMQP